MTDIELQLAIARIVLFNYKELALDIMNLYQRFVCKSLVDPDHDHGADRDSFLAGRADP